MTFCERTASILSLIHIYDTDTYGNYRPLAKGFHLIDTFCQYWRKAGKEFDTVDVYKRQAKLKYNTQVFLVNNKDKEQ